MDGSVHDGIVVFRFPRCRNKDVVDGSVVSTTRSEVVVGTAVEDDFFLESIIRIGRIEMI